MNLRINTNSSDIVCFSHLRWDFVFQRPQHLITRFAKKGRAYFIEEPLPGDQITFRISRRENGLSIVTPILPEGFTQTQRNSTLQKLLHGLFKEEKISDYVTWYYTPMALSFSRHLQPSATIYDCMDELSTFEGAPSSLLDYEVELLHRADLVFTGGQSLFEAKRHRHTNVHAMPSSIDANHFMRARQPQTEPADQAHIQGIKLGFAGVIDERLDVELLNTLAQLLPSWQFIMLGPIVKIDPAILPRYSNIHYLGQKQYAELPAYMSAWDIAFLPFARNKATRYISPTKTPEYLAAGLPVISTSIRDVISPYADLGLVHIADTASEFAQAAEKLLAESKTQKIENRQRADAFLSQQSWDKTWQRMVELMGQAKMTRSRRREFVKQMTHTPNTIRGTRRAIQRPLIAGTDG